MEPVGTFTVIPKLPARLERLRELAGNLRWAWDYDTISLFRRLDAALWETTGHNPVRMLGTVDQARLNSAANDDGFCSHFDRVLRDFDTYMAAKSTWFSRSHSDARESLVAYFSAEFGLTECLSIFAGGLGLLAGDHLKSASDLGVPLIGVGLLYQQGYFRQYLNEAGWQQEAYVENDFFNLPLVLERRRDGVQLSVEVELPGRVVHARIWRAQVGRVALYLLDTNVAENTNPQDRDLTDQLYGGDLETRIRQEILLGIGGYRALEALGLAPTVCHMNEGHSAFLAIERIRRLMERYGLSFAEAREQASSGLVFTSHTPVPAGHDYFPAELMDRYFGDYYRALGLSRRDFLALGRRNAGDDGEPFCMTVLAMRLSTHSNGVSRLHGEVTRRMWQQIWPGVPVEEIPIGYVTNGVHFRTWISPEMDQLYDRYLGPRWKDEPADQSSWLEIAHVPAEELWRTHEIRHERLVAFARRRLHEQLSRRGAPEAEIEEAGEVLELGALTIGFARRFATYKRATLIFRDPDRLARILNDPKRPVQLIFAGKAHPKDDAGKEFIRQIVQFARDPRFRRRVVFIEDYDTSVARYLLQGADVWLNTPRRPQEASGTSGMKAAANGVLNLSTLDGWWDEAWHESDSPSKAIGWAIGRGENYDNADRQDQVEAEALYDLLEQDVVPTFYDQTSDGVPKRWVARMKTSIEVLSHYFNTHRMVREYAEHFYLPASERYRAMTAEGWARTRSLAAWRVRVEAAWPRIQIIPASAKTPAEIQVGGALCLAARVDLGTLTPDDVSVELYLGQVNAAGQIVSAEVTPMAQSGVDGDGLYLFEVTVVPSERSGLHGYTIRVLPRHPDLPTPYLPGLITWAKPS